MESTQAPRAETYRKQPTGYRAFYPAPLPPEPPVRTEQPETKLNLLVLPIELTDRLQRVLQKYRQQDKLKQHGLSHRRKVHAI